jgi:hypothetical protein
MVLRRVRDTSAQLKVLAPCILRHCEERSDEAIQTVSVEAFWIASAFAKASADTSLRSQ